MALFSPDIVLSRGKKSIIYIHDKRSFYDGHLGIKRDVIGTENTYFLNVKLYYSIS